MQLTTTYRLQLNNEFDFYKLKSELKYLIDLGIKSLCLSPIFMLRRPKACMAMIKSIHRE